MSRSTKYQVVACCNDAKHLLESVRSFYQEGRIKINCFTFFYNLDRESPTSNHDKVIISFRTDENMTVDDRQEIFKSIYEKANNLDIIVKKIEIIINPGNDDEQRYTDI